MVCSSFISRCISVFSERHGAQTGKNGHKNTAVRRKASLPHSSRFGYSTVSEGTTEAFLPCGRRRIARPRITDPYGSCPVVQTPAGTARSAYERHQRARPPTAEDSPVHIFSATTTAVHTLTSLDSNIFWYRCRSQPDGVLQPILFYHGYFAQSNNKFSPSVNFL